MTAHIPQMPSFAASLDLLSNLWVHIKRMEGNEAMEGMEGMEAKKASEVEVSLNRALH